MNGVKKQDIDEFVVLVSGKGLSIRDIDLLCDGYFKGSEEFRQQIKTGDIGWGLKQLKETESTGCTPVESQLLKEIEITRCYINRVIYRSRDAQIFSKDFYSQWDMLAPEMLRRLAKCKQVLEDLHERSANA